MSFFSLSIAKDSVKQIKSVAVSFLGEYVGLNNIQMVQWCSLVIACLPSTCEVLGSILSTHPTPQKNGVKNQVESVHTQHFLSKVGIKLFRPRAFCLNCYVCPQQGRAGAWTPFGSSQGTIRN